jgi:phosphoserine phosphatase
MINGIRVISLDLDGVLFDGPSAAFPIAQRLGLGQKFLAVYTQLAKEGRRFEDSIIEGSKIWKGIATEGAYNHLVIELPLRVGAQETVNVLKEKGYFVGCISSGVSQFFMAPFSERLNLDFAFSNILGEEEGAHSGEAEYIMGGPQKVETALNFLKEKGFEAKNLASIGDGANDIDLFNISGFSIAFNPEKKKVIDAASITIRSKDLRSILEYF